MNLINNKQITRSVGFILPHSCCLIHVTYIVRRSSCVRPPYLKTALIKEQFVPIRKYGNCGVGGYIVTVRSIEKSAANTCRTDISLKDSDQKHVMFKLQP